MSQPEDKEKSEISIKPVLVTLTKTRHSSHRKTAAILSIFHQKSGSNSVHCMGPKCPEPREKKWRWCFTGEKPKTNHEKPSQTISPQGANTNKINKQTTTPIDVRTSHQNFEATSAQQLLETSTRRLGKWSSFREDHLVGLRRLRRRPSLLVESPSLRRSLFPPFLGNILY